MGEELVGGPNVPWSYSSKVLGPMVPSPIVLRSTGGYLKDKLDS